MLLPILITLLLQFPVLINCDAVDQYGVSLYNRLEVMERLLLNTDNVAVSVNPCSFFRTSFPVGSANSGEQTSAEWVRIVFHDSITANVAAGTGGLDASISWESDRAENVGIHFINETITIFESDFSIFTSMSDVIALGLADTLISCDPIPRRIKLRVGRIDATGPGPAGVPKPTDDLNTTLAAFAQAGFSQSEAIASVACGHSLGSVHQTNFPDIVPASAVTPTNLDGAMNFDSTTAVFDNANVNEYLNGSGKAGGPLVVGFNETTNSDLRLFSSDGNATIQTLTSAQAFQDTCYTLFEKMFNTVPSTVTLSEIIGPRTWTTQEKHLDLSSTGAVQFSGVITWYSLTDTPPLRADYTDTTSEGGDVGILTRQIGASTSKHGFGTITQFSFNDTLPSSDIMSFSVMDGAYTAPVDQSLFILPSQSKRGGTISNGQVKSMYLIRAAILTSLTTNTSIPTAVVYYPATQPGTLTPRVNTTSTPMTIFNTIENYTVFQGVITMPNTGTSAGVTYLGVTFGDKMSVKLSTTNIGSCSNPVITNC